MRAVGWWWAVDNPGTIKLAQKAPFGELTAYYAHWAQGSKINVRRCCASAISKAQNIARVFAALAKRKPQRTIERAWRGKIIALYKVF